MPSRMLEEWSNRLAVSRDFVDATKDGDSRAAFRGRSGVSVARARQFRDALSREFDARRSTPQRPMGNRRAIDGTRIGAGEVGYVVGDVKIVTSKGALGMTELIRVDTMRAEWRPTSTPGITFQSLRYNRESKAGAVLIKMEPGTSYPAHEHTKGEDVFIVEGELIVGANRFPKGAYLYSPPGSIHAPRTETGCILFSTFPGKIDHAPSKR